MNDHTAAQRLLILYVDFDDDLGLCGINTPVVGVEHVIDTAMKFALCKPSDSDLNALFYAIKVYNSLRDQGNDVEIAIATGARNEPKYMASIKFSNALDEIKRRTGANRVLVVLDSVEDEHAIPLIAQRFNIVGIENVVVEQPRSIETFYTSLLRIGRKILSESKYARIVLGYPGFALLIFTILSLFNLTHLALYTLLIFVSMLMIVRGFGLFEYVKELTQRPFKPLVLGLTVFLLSLSLYLGYLEIMSLTTSQELQPFKAIAIAIQDQSHLAFLAIAVPIIVKLFRELYEKQHRYLILRIAFLTDLLLAYVLIQNIALIMRMGIEASIFAVTNSLVVVIAMIVLTAISEAVVRKG
ncbi:MAG TPA: DUF373 family protein [Ignisphaera sp.]|uniref:DUF373 family protein n=1 Tax=Ignisphaera aggregans TaxID=334771 RepID=A0A833DU84_9CREN|nr:DUF373 family protein [Ignisphaera sp.]HIP56944.1 DUF373 family protein [Ignisphaera aggregans]